MCAYFTPFIYPEFEARWQPSGGAERADYSLFLTDLCDLMGMPHPDATTDSPAQDAYMLERAVTFDDGASKKSTDRIDLYKRGCFVLKTKQGTDSLDTTAPVTTAQVAARFRRTRTAQVQPLLAILTALSLLRHLEPEDTCAA